MCARIRERSLANSLESWKFSFLGVGVSRCFLIRNGTSTMELSRVDTVRRYARSWGRLRSEGEEHSKMKIRGVAQASAVLMLLVAVGFAFGCGSPSQAQSTSPSSSVLVTNTESQPVPTISTNAQNSFYGSGSCNWSNSSECQVIPLLSVAANQTAVVESISGLCQLDAGTQIAYYQLPNEQSQKGMTFLPPSATVPYNIGTMLGSSTTVTTAFNYNIKTYFHGGASGVTVFFNAFATAGETAVGDNCTVTLSGHFAPVP